MSNTAQFQLRFPPALASKPKSNKSSNSKPVDPFENPPPGLFITDIAPAHYLVLNKFPVIPDHFILATKVFKQQTDLLEEDDLVAAYQCLRAYKEVGEELFGFFNSGEHSGASQPHRHIQFIPVRSMRSGIDSGIEWDVLADSLIKSPQPDLPFKYFASAMPINPSAKQIYETYRSLYDNACGISDIKPTDGTISASISYNIGLTDRAMVLCPRISEGLKVQGTHGELLGPIALNGTILGGTLLVKAEDEWDALRNDNSKLVEILNAIGVSSNTFGYEGHL